MSSAFSSSIDCDDWISSDSCFEPCCLVLLHAKTEKVASNKMMVFFILIGNFKLRFCSRAKREE